MLVEMNLWPSPPPTAFTTTTDLERLLVVRRIREHNSLSSIIHFPVLATTIITIHYLVLQHINKGTLWESRMIIIGCNDMG